jgi:hypothetical protein
MGFLVGVKQSFIGDRRGFNKLESLRSSLLQTLWITISTERAHESHDLPECSIGKIETGHCGAGDLS